MRLRLTGGLVVLATVLAACSSVPTFTKNDLPAGVQVTDQGSWISMKTSVPREDIGLIFYPGGFVKPEAYLKALAPIAEAGYLVMVARMPFDLAFFDAEKGVEVPRAHPEVARWVIGGHSLGGVASAIAVQKHPTAFRGIVFWASYPAEANSLASTSVPALSISASLDGLSTPAKVLAAAPFLPENTRKVVIEGGNHAQFGDYGAQKGDGTPQMSREEQQALATKAVLEFLRTL